MYDEYLIQVAARQRERELRRAMARYEYVREYVGPGPAFKIPLAGVVSRFARALRAASPRHAPSAAPSMADCIPVNC